jgi:hypothetical protein
MNSFRRFCVLGISLTALSLVGCGDDSNNNSSNADAQAYLASCQKLCDAQAAKACDTGGLTVTAADCKNLCQLATTMTGDCAAKYKAYGQCTDTAPDVCTADTTTCATQLSAANTACGYTT